MDSHSERGWIKQSGNGSVTVLLPGSAVILQVMRPWAMDYGGLSEEVFKIEFAKICVAPSFLLLAGAIILLLVHAFITLPRTY